MSAKIIIVMATMAVRITASSTSSSIVVSPRFKMGISRESPKGYLEKPGE
ncbi:MAG: hypothetical protein P8Y06_00500 [Patescibacteria group bacterium]